jgi:hypothetical protein
MATGYKQIKCNGIRHKVKSDASMNFFYRKDYKWSWKWDILLQSKSWKNHINDYLH